jgi:2,3-bisphosphoglycerate-dependent phosphoglycerate mutase
MCFISCHALGEKSKYSDTNISCLYFGQTIDRASSRWRNSQGKAIYTMKNKKHSLILMRHGQSQWNLENRFTGFKDVELTDLGREEARNAGAKIKQSGFDFDAVFTSTLKRANETAKLALTEAGQAELIADMIYADELRERDYGDLTGLNKDETRQKYGDEQVHIWRRSYDVQPPNGESLKDVVENRVRPYFEREIKPRMDKGETILIAAHGNSLRALLIILGENTPENINETEIPTGSPLVISYEDGKRVSKGYL